MQTKERDHEAQRRRSRHVAVSRDDEALDSPGSGSSQLQHEGQLRRRKPPKFRNVAQMVMQMNRQSGANLFDDAPASGQTASDRNINSQSGDNTQANTGHRRGYSTSNVPYVRPSIGPFKQVDLPGMFSSSESTPTTNFMDHARHLEQLFAPGLSDSYEDLADNNFRQRGGDYARVSQDEEDSDVSPISSPEREHNLAGRRQRRHSRPSADFEVIGADVELGRQQQPNDNTPLLTTRHRARRMRFCHDLIMTLKPGEIVNNLQYFISTTVLLFMAPCLLLAAILFYVLENPDLEFLPSEAKLPWFLLFAVRLSVTFTLAQICQWFLQLVAMRTSIFARLAGPLLALVAMQSLGWPCILSFWGLVNLIVLHGESKFAKHWLWFTGIKLFSIEHNTGDGFLASNLYGRILFAMILAGIAAAIKRTFVALYLSRRMLQYYRPQLEQVMRRVKVVIEVAELASETEQPDFNQLLANANQVALEHKKSKLMDTVPTFAPTNQKKGNGNDDDDDDDDDLDNDDENEDENSSIQQSLAGTESSDPKFQWSLLKSRALNDRYSANFSAEGSNSGGSSTKNGKGHRRGTARTSSRGFNSVFPFLERWQEPEDKGKSKRQPTLHDILQFRKAMAFMETEYPFSPAFGLVKNRKACVKNAVRVYNRLLKFIPGKSILGFDVVGALAYEEDGEINEERAIPLLRIFLPDKNDNLSMVGFVQSIDNVYKQMRFLRASLSNSSKIDSVLEDIFNILFFAVLFVLVLTVLGFNIWPLLVSFSTLTVSFAFAFGPSVAKNVEGILLIAIRRPYDIGDRITICSADTVANPAPGDTWLVEDISLTTTTLRYAATNEVATINNASVANTRIVNCARSPKASVTFRMRFKVDATQKQVDEFRMRVESYMEDRPRTWVGLIHYRMEATDSDNGFVAWMFRAQHNKSWQELGPIMTHKGELENFADALATEIGINYESPVREVNVGLSLSKDIKTGKKMAGDILQSLGGGERDFQVESRNPDEQIYGAISEYFDAGVPSSAPDNTGTTDDGPGYY